VSRVDQLHRAGRLRRLRRLGRPWIPDPTSPEGDGDGHRIHFTDIRRRCPVSAVWQPTQAELLAVSARTAAAIEDPLASPADIQRLAELEEAAYSEIELGPCDRPTDPGPLHSRVDYSPEIDAEVAEAEAELEAELEAAF
jgi:hypothetical protein